MKSCKVRQFRQREKPNNYVYEENKESTEKQVDDDFRYPSSVSNVVCNSPAVAFVMITPDSTRDSISLGSLHAHTSKGKDEVKEK